MTAKTTCIDCGTETLSGGLRCRKCHGAYMRRLSLEATAGTDRSLLAEVEKEGLNSSRLAARYGISRVRATQKIALARKREAARQAMAAEDALSVFV